MRALIILAVLMLTACSATVDTPPPPQQPAQVIVVQSPPPTVVNDSGDDVLLFIVAMLLIAALFAVACLAAYMLGHMHGQRDNLTPHVRQLPPLPNVVVITESEYWRRLNQSREVSRYE